MGCKGRPLAERKNQASGYLLFEGVIWRRGAMNKKTRERARKLVQLLAPEDYDRLMQIRIRASDFGYDPLGLERESAMLAFALFQFVHKYWFRVQSHGVEHVPPEGPVLMVPNHSGGIPIDGVMIAVDLAKRMEKPRVMRTVVDNFAGSLPFINTFFYRSGQVIGARRNLTDLLRRGEMIAVFPEGTKGTGKKYKDRYKLVPFNVGFIELSLKYNAPIVPTAVIGAEEQYTHLLNIKPLAKLLNLPYYPLPPLSFLMGPVGLLPLPTKYYIYYGEPIHFYRGYSVESIKDPDTVRKLANYTRTRIMELIEKGLKYRKGVFGVSLSSGKHYLLGEVNKAVNSTRTYLKQRTGTYVPSRRKPAPAQRTGRQMRNRSHREEEFATWVNQFETISEQRIRELELAVVQLQKMVIEGRQAEQRHQIVH
jgi:1-acyl-sn-glycerol-3-phosphate acyltransferase